MALLCLAAFSLIAACPIAAVRRQSRCCSDNVAEHLVKPSQLGQVLRRAS
jgi:hypothetical protein